MIDPEDLPEGIEGVDAGDVEWKETAETLQARVTELEAELAAANSKLDVRDSATEALEQLRAQIAAEKPDHPALKDYKVDERVTVLKNYTWLEGQITSIDRGSNNLHVHTERGPVTIASPMFVKKLT